MTSHPVFDITGRTALVTGSSRGIGLALAAGLLEAGAKVVLNGRDEERLELARADLAQRYPGAQVRVVAFDVTDSASVKVGMDRVLDAVGHLDILVNNAGLQRRAPITEFTDEDWHALLSTNLTSAFLMSRAAAQHMVTRGRGAIINICSVQTALARPGIAPYSATKGGLKMLTQGLCADLGPHGIQVNGLAPGYFATELTAPLVADEDFTTWVSKRTPAGRWGDVRELVGATIFLASDASSFVNGQVIFVDGGMTAVL